MKIYDDRDQRTYNSVYSTRIKEDFYGLVKDLNEDINNGSLSKWHLRHLDLSYDGNLYSYDGQSCFDVHINPENDTVIMESYMGKYSVYCGRSGRTSKSCHINIVWDNPKVIRQQYYRKLLKLKIGMLFKYKWVGASRRLL